MRNIPVWGKVALALATAAVITLVVAAGGYLGILRTEDALTTTARRSLPAQYQLLVLRNALTALQRAERTRLIPETEENPQLMQRQKDNLVKYWAQAEAAMKAFEALPAPDGRPEAKNPDWLAFKNAWDDWGGRHRRVLELLDGDMRMGAMALSMREARESLQGVEAALDKLMIQERAGTDGFVNEALPRARRDQMLLLGAALLAVVVSLAFGAWVASNINRPLRRTLAFAERVADGDLTAELPVDRRDELGKMARALGLMVRSLRKEIALAGECRLEAENEAEHARCAVEEARTAGLKAELSRREGMRQAAERMGEVVDRLGAGSQQLSAQVEQSARGAGEQSRLSVETAGAMERLLEAVDKAGKGAARAAETAEAAKTRAGEGERAVAEVARVVAAVQDRAGALRVSMDALHAKSEDIGRIITVIADIADQTNLLALNAAIEAARAGDAGRGFAVVADEVRKLAEKTQAATKQVDAAIRGIQAETRGSLDQVELAGRAVSEATTRADASAASLREIAALTARTNEEIRAIAAAAAHQAEAGREVNESVAHMHGIGEQTGAAMDESARAVAELADQASRLSVIMEDIRSDAEDADPTDDVRADDAPSEGMVSAPGGEGLDVAA